MTRKRKQAATPNERLLVTPQQAARQILGATLLEPKLAIVLGSGFDAIRTEIEVAVEIPYSALPGFLPTRIVGHEGQLLIGRLAAAPVIVLCGRAHYYEGHCLAELTFPVRVLAACGVRVLILTNAAGGINSKYRPGDFMCLTDHLNFMGNNPLRGSVVGDEPRFVDLTQAYDPQLNKLFAKAARQNSVRLHFGVYAAVSGPCYETPAEIRAFAMLGADAVGMSTVPEVIVGRQCGLRVAALSCITNPAAGLAKKTISHLEVLETGRRVQHQASALLTTFVRLVAADPRPPTSR